MGWFEIFVKTLLWVLGTFAWVELLRLFTDNMDEWMDGNYFIRVAGFFYVAVLCSIPLSIFVFWLVSWHASK